MGISLKEKYSMIQIELSKIIIDEKRQDQIIVLKEKEGDRQFPIVIGFGSVQHQDEIIRC